MSEVKYANYKIIVMPFSKEEAKQIRNYLAAFEPNKTVYIEGIEP